MKSRSPDRCVDTSVRESRLRHIRTQAAEAPKSRSRGQASSPCNTCPAPYRPVCQTAGCSGRLIIPVRSQTTSALLASRSPAMQERSAPELSTLWIEAAPGRAQPAHIPRVPNVRTAALAGVSSTERLRGRHCNGSPASDRRRAAHRVVAPALQAQLPRTSPSCCSSADSRSRTRRSEAGSSASRRCSPTSSAPGGAAVPGSPGTSTRRT